MSVDSFESLGVIKPILDALKEKNYLKPTDIQRKAIPLVLKRKDVLGSAQTGTGKTAAFAIPIIQLIHKIEGKQKNRKDIRALILTPTRELAIQIGENIEEYSKYTNVKHTVIFGGVKQNQQVRALNQGVHILVATPGRLLDLVAQGYINLDTLKMFVLDEADRMLDMGFIHDVKKLLKILPQKKQSLFFSATMPDNIINLSKSILFQPTKIEVTPVSSAATTIRQYLYYTNRTSKKELLMHILEENEIEQVLLFARTKRGADRIARDLKKNNINSQAIHGDKTQQQRQKALRQFKEGRLRVLVATDIAARGIDIDKLSYVINYEIPNEPETYVHRIGRTGRAGERGVAISLCEPEENAYVKDIQKLIKKDIKVIDDNPFPQTDKPMTEKEKKEWNKEKQRRKMDFIAKRKASVNRKGGYNPRSANSSKGGKFKPRFKSNAKRG